MKRILIFSVAYQPFIGGAEIAIQEITSRIGDIQFDLITLNLDGKQKPEENIGNVSVYRIGGKSRLSKYLFPFTAAKKAQELHTAHPYDATLSVMASFSGFAGSFFKAKHPSVPFILNLQEGDPIPEIKRKVALVYPLYKKIFTRADKIQTISTYLADFARDMGAKAPITVIPNGADIAHFSQGVSESEVSELRRELHLRETDKVLITTSRLVKKNGVEDIIESLVSLPENVKLLILGIGGLEMPLKRLVKKLNLKDRVTFVGHVNYETLPRYLSISDIFIRPSLSEGMGNSFIEAMAAGVPVIATPVGGIPDFLKDSETGLFCGIQNPKSIAERVTLLLNDNNLREKIIQNAKKLVQEKYDWDLIAERMRKEVLG